jgi:hypothetical protein
MPRDWHTKVVGVTFPNTDGGDRQHLISAIVQVGAEAHLVADPTNPHDANAHGVWIEYRSWFILKRRAQIGFLSAWVAKDIASKKRTGHSFRATVASVTGGTNGRSFGVVLRITETWISPH